MELFSLVVDGLTWLFGAICFFVLAAFPVLMATLNKKDLTHGR